MKPITMMFRADGTPVTTNPPKGQFAVMRFPVKSIDLRFREESSGHLKEEVVFSKRWICFYWPFEHTVSYYAEAGLDERRAIELVEFAISLWIKPWFVGG